jgi:Tfp pilus assembly protein PilO
MKLSRRELILLVGLLLIGLVFGGYRFVYQPFQTRINDLQTEMNQATSQKDLALTEIATLKSYTERRTKAVATITDVSADFLPGLPVASILLYVHDTINESGLRPSNYLISPESAVVVTTTSTSDLSLSYPIASLAQQYRDLMASTGDPAATPTPAPSTGATVADPTHQIGLLTVKLSLVGTYAQCKDFINRINSLERTMVITRIGYAPTGTTTGELRDFNFEIDIDFYGIEKILDQTDDTFTWTRPDTTGKPFPFES